MQKFRQGFTLAEVLITLGVIGVVAAITLPTLITNINERRNSERQANIAQKVTQAMETMRAHGLLNTQYASTEAFVDELQKYLKISKRCDKDHLTDCWPTSTIIDHDGNEYNVADAKTGAQIGKEESTTNNVGLVLADGAPIILNYDNTKPGIDVGDKVSGESKSLPVGRNKSKEFPYTTGVTGSIDFIMDINGTNKPNREMDTNNKYYDIRSFKTAHFSTGILWENGSAGKILYLGQQSSSDYVDCRSSNSSSADYQTYCNYGGHPYEWNLDDYWAGALKACVEVTKGKGSLPNVSKLQEIYNHRTEYPSLASETHLFWTSEENSAGPYQSAMYVPFTSHPGESAGSAYGTNKNSSLSVVCVAN